MLKGMGADLIGSADICKCISKERIATENFANMAPIDETVFIYLRSKKEEHMFTNKAYYSCMGQSGASTKRLVKRFDYYSNVLTGVMFETSGYGLTDRDCELKFTIGDTYVSIDIWKKEDATVRVYYKALTELADLQMKNAKKMVFIKEALAGRGVNKMEVKDGTAAAGIFQAIEQDAKAWGLFMHDSFQQEDFTECFTKYLGPGMSQTTIVAQPVPTSAPTDDGPSSK